MKKIIYGALVATAAVSASIALSSCEDMLKPESDLVMYPEDNQIDTPYDTLYSVVGILHLMEKVVDRTNLLGEVRSDLVTLTPSASQDLQELASSTTSVKNIYNNPQDYYAIINNCNYYIANADSTYKKQGVKVFERELSVVHSFRAWTYLQLALNYGEIPFYTDFLDTQKDANAVMKQPKRSIKEVCSFLANDLLPWAYTKPLVYGKTSFNSFRMDELYVPVKLMLAEMYLWSEQYEDAAFWYHEYLTDKENPKPVGIGVAYRSYANGVYSQSYSYSPRGGYFLLGNGDAMNGDYCHLRDIYCSTDINKYYYEVTYSASALARSSSQKAVVVAVGDNLKRDTIPFIDFDLSGLENGDLRMRSILSVSSVHSDNIYYSDAYQMISSKFGSSTSYSYIPLYRTTVVYLHFAEALNRAGYPTAAFAILKYGLCEDNTTNRAGGNPIAADEVERAGNLLYFDPQYFKGADYTTVVKSGDDLSTIVISDGSTAVSPNTLGIHALGGTAVDCDTNYVIPVLATAADTMLWVEDKIIDELALETIFEGQRFYDLMRVALRRDDNSYLAKAIGNRDNLLGTDAYNSELETRLMDKRNWYLPFQK